MSATGWIFLEISVAFKAHKQIFLPERNTDVRKYGQNDEDQVINALIFIICPI